MRALATVRRIDALDPIPNADAIEVATVGGWKVVAQKGLYTVGDLAVYFEIDSWIPHEIAPFLSKDKAPREYFGVKGERLRTVTLRKQRSQGLLMPLRELKLEGEIVEGQDLTEALNIQKWEKAIPPELSGLAKSNFPSKIPKTDQERIQNLKQELAFWAESEFEWEATEKLEGSSMTVYLIDGEFGVCSRNIDLLESEGNSFWKMAREENIEELLRNAGLDNIAIQGELIGPGIQENIYGLAEHHFYVYDVYDIKTGSYYLPKERRKLIEDDLLLSHVPVIDAGFTTDKDATMESLLLYADGPSRLNVNTLREGVVFKSKAFESSFKAISNKYLDKHD